jgi:hypothetical protein
LKLFVLIATKSFKVEKSANLFCCIHCRDEARLIRYVLRCKRDGRLNRLDVQQAIKIKFGFALSDIGYDEKARRLSPKIRSKVIKRDKGKCRKCGKPGTEIDHKAGSSSALSNLQLLCQSCHFDKTEASMIPISPTDDEHVDKRKKYTKLMKRIKSKEPIQICDNDVT